MGIVPRMRSRPVSEVSVASLAMLRRLRVERRVGLLALTVVLAVGILSGIPRYVDRVSERGLHQAVGDAAAQNSGLAVDIADRIDITPGGDVLTDLQARGAQFRAALPAAVEAVLGDGHVVADTPTMELVDARGNPLYGSLLQYPRLRIRYQDDVWNHVTLVDGRQPTTHAPSTIGETIADPSGIGPDVRDRQRPVFEIVATRATLDALRVKIGDRFLVMPTAGDTMPAGVLDVPRDLSVIAEVVGVIDVSDPSDPYWFGNGDLNQPSITSLHESYYISAVALTAPSEQVYGDLYRATKNSATAYLDWHYRWEYLAVARSFSTSKVGQLRDGLRNLQATKGPITRLSPDPGTVEIHTGLPQIIDQFQAQRDAMVNVLTVAILGLFAMVVAVFALAIILIDERRRAALILLRSRGASRSQLLATQLTEVALVCVPAAIAGFFSARLLLGSGADGGALLISLAVLIGFVVAGVCASLEAIFRPLGSLARRTRRVDRSPLPILALEGTIILLSVAGVLLIRRRGLIAADGDSNHLSVDPYLAAVPMLLSLSAGLITRRLVMVLARAGERLAARQRGLVLILGLRRMRAWTWAESLPLAVMIVAVSLGVFTFIIDNSLQRAINRTSWQTVGADYQIQLPHGLPDSINLSDPGGVQAVARSMVLNGVQLNPSAGQPRLETIIGLEPSAYAALTAATPLAGTLPASFVATDQGANLPGIVSTSLIADLNLTVGGNVTIQLGNSQRTVHIVAARDSLPGMPALPTFLLIPYDALHELAEANDANVTSETLFLSGEQDAGSALRSRFGDESIAATILSRDDVYRQLRDAPLSQGIVSGFRLAYAVALLCAVDAGVLGLILTNWQRDQETAYLRVLGLSRSQGNAILMLEQLPGVLVAGVAGALLGIGILWLIAPGIELGSYVGIQHVPIVVNGLAILALVGGMVGALTAAVLCAGFVIRRTHLALSLRLSER